MSQSEFDKYAANDDRQQQLRDGEKANFPVQSQAPKNAMQL